MTMTTLARATDPMTSHLAAEETTTKVTHRDALLFTFEGKKWGQTADEAAKEAGLLDTGYWKRISDLHTAGLLVEDQFESTRPGRSGRLQRVLHITAKGLARLDDLRGIAR